MRYRRFGKTELQMPVITCGAMRFQHSWSETEPIPESSQRNVEGCVRRALELGINHIETARGYGTSEYQLGKVLPKLDRDRIVVQTKVGPDKDVKKYVEKFEKSMRLLHVDYLDLFAMHGVNDTETFEAAMICLEQTLKWKAEGRIRHIGFSTHGPVEILMKAVCTGAFEYINLHWYFIFQDNWPVIVEAHKRDMGVLIISPNDKAGMLYRPSQKLTELCAPLHPIVFNGLFCLAQPEVHTLSCGVSKPKDFDLHIETVAQLDRAAELSAPIVARLERAMLEAVGEDWARTWQVGLPEWQETPGGINIPWILRLRNLVLAYDMLEFGKMRYNLLGSGGNWFPGNQAANLDKIDLSKCLKRSPHADKIPAALAEAHALLKGEAVKRLQQDN